MAELQAAIEDANKHLKGTDNDHKVGALQTLEQELHAIPGQDVDTASLESIASLLKVSLRNGNSRVYAAGLSCTLAYFKVADEQWQEAHQSGQPVHQLESIFKNAVTTLALPPGGLLTFLGDAKDSVRTTARSALLQSAKTSAAISSSNSRLPPDQQPLALLDKAIKEHGFASKSGKIREQSLLYLTELRNACPTLPLRAWVPILVNSLEDSDPIVRDMARESIITIFTAPTVGVAAKADLKKELVKQGVRKTTCDVILRRTLGTGAASSSSSVTGSPPSAYGALASELMSSGRRTPSMSGRLPSRPPSVNSMGRSPSSGSLPRQSSGGSTTAFKPTRGDRLLKEPKNLTHEEILANLEAVAAANAPPPTSNEANTVQVVYIASVRDLEQEFAAMQPCFAGKETEFNWQEREKAIFRIRGMLQGQVQQTLRSAFVASLKSMVEGILKATNSLRTTLAAAACQLIVELAEGLKDGMSQLFEPLFSGQLKLASLTKKVIATASQESVTALLRNCPYNAKTLPLLAAMLDQKNATARVFAAQHLKTFVEAQAKLNKEAIESNPTSGPALIVQMLKKELADANSTVRETARATFWLFYDIWSSQAQTLLESSDSVTRRALEKADSRSNAAGSSSQAKAGASASARKPASGRPSMRELISSRRAAQISNLDSSQSLLSSSMPASSSTPRDADDSSGPSATPGPSTTGVMHRELSSPPARPRLSTQGTTPTKRPSSFYGKPTSSHIPSPPRSSQHSPRSRTFSGDFTQRRSISHTYQSPREGDAHKSNFEESTTPTRRAFPGDAPVKPPQAYSNSNASSSPPLQAPSGMPDDSDIEASTFQVMPDGLESTDDESVNLLNYDPPQAQPRQNGQADYDQSERSKILDGLMDLSFESTDNIEVEEAVKGRAEQAEQTAHRFLELTEPEADNTEDNVGDTTVLQQQADLSAQDIPVPYTPQAKLLPGPEDGFNSKPISTMPLIQQLQHLSFADSPAVPRVRTPGSLPLVSLDQDRWWIDKAELTLASHAIEGPISSEVLQDLISRIESRSVDKETILQLAAISKKTQVASDDAAAEVDGIWKTDHACTRIVDDICQVLQNEDDNNFKFYCLVALLNLFTYQAPLLDGLEMKMVEMLFNVSHTLDKTIRTGAETVLLTVLSKTEPLYGISCLRLSLQQLPLGMSKAGTAPTREDMMSAWTFSMGLKAMSTLFGMLPAEVLEEEVSRAREIILKAMNSSHASLRQTAATVIVKAHQTIQDDTKLFDLIDGLTKSQMNLCTYLFARSTDTS